MKFISINSFLFTISTKVMTEALAIYLINRLLVPKLLYISQIMIISEVDWIKLYISVLKFIKRKFSLALNFSTQTLYHDNIFGVANIWQEYCTYISIIFTACINTSDCLITPLHKDSTLMQIRTFQLSAYIMKPIWNSLD